MSDTKILQAILDNVVSLETKMDSGFKKIDVRFEKIENRLNQIGLWVAQFEDDSPTRKELNSLEKRIVKLEQRPTLNL